MKSRSLCALVLAIAGCISKGNLMELASSSKLYVNRFNNPHYSVKKSQEEGERDLVELAKTSEYEEAWLFDKKTSTWFETGTDESKDKVTTDFNNINISKNLIHYHIHPAYIFKKRKEDYEEVSKREEAIKESLRRPSVSEEERIQLKMGLIEAERTKLFNKIEYLFLAAFPSPIDLDFIVNKRHLNSVIVSEYGIMECFPRQKDEETNFITKYRLITPEIVGLKLEDGYTEEAAILLAVEYANKRILDGKVKLNFKPFKKIPVPPFTGGNKN